VDTHQAFIKACICIKKASGYPLSILKCFYWHKKGWWIHTKHFKRLLISIKKAGGYPPSILKVFYWHKKGWWIPTKDLKRPLLA
jgi:hypothetical protein